MKKEILTDEVSCIAETETKKCVGVEARLLVYCKLVPNSFNGNNFNRFIIFQIVTQLCDVDVQVARIEK